MALHLATSAAAPSPTAMAPASVWPAANSKAAAPATSAKAKFHSRRNNAVSTGTSSRLTPAPPCPFAARASLGKLGDPGHDLLARGARVEHVPHAGLPQLALVLVGHDAADHHRHVLEPRFLQGLHQLGHQQVVGGERGDADHVDVLLLGEAHHLADLLPRRRIEHLHTGVAQERGHDPAAAIMPVEARSW